MARFLPVLYGNPDDPFLNYDEDLMGAITPAAEAALEALKNAVAQVYQGGPAQRWRFALHRQPPHGAWPLVIYAPLRRV